MSAGFVFSLSPMQKCMGLCSFVSFGINSIERIALAGISTTQRLRKTSSSVHAQCGLVHNYPDSIPQ